MSGKPRVLIVDDEPDVVANWARLLGREDYAFDAYKRYTVASVARPDGLMMRPKTITA
jgi:CheY-like chemotaxis protein